VSERVLFRDRDDGAYAIFAAVIALALLIAVGLVVDGSGKAAAGQRASAAAQEAARAAGQAINVGESVQGRPATVDTPAAATAARRYLSTAGVQGTVTITSPTTLSITTSTTYQPVFLSIIGVGTLTGTGSATATLNGTLNNPANVGAAP